MPGARRRKERAAGDVGLSYPARAERVPEGTSGTRFFDSRSPERGAIWGEMVDPSAMGENVIVRMVTADLVECGRRVALDNDLERLVLRPNEGETAPVAESGEKVFHC